MMYEMEKLERAFTDNNIWASVEPCPDNDVAGVVSVTIEWGDWKHDHLRADWIAKEAGFTSLGESLVEEDGSDCYSAIHYYIYTGDAEAMELCDLMCN